jgi:hypothetical protein
MLGALDVTQSELDTLQSMLASSQVTLNLDTLREVRYQSYIFYLLVAVRINIVKRILCLG